MNILFGIAIGYLIGCVSGYTIAMFKLLKIIKLSSQKKEDM